MKKNKKFGFSLAELLISLLIISIVLAAAIPTVTKRAASSREQIWRWASTNNNAFFGVGEYQSALLGMDKYPNIDDYFGSGHDADSSTLNFTPTADKLVITQRGDLGRSHISFFTTRNNAADATLQDTVYAGRLALDRNNIALGIGTLQHQSPGVIENLAVGHHALYKNTTGAQNTAFGSTALTANTGGTYNTAIGNHSLFKLSGDTSHTNTALGAYSCARIQAGNNNVCIGYNAGKALPDTATPVVNRLFIGSNDTTHVANTDLITGYMDFDGAPTPSYDKELTVNARNFNVSTFDGTEKLFTVQAKRGAFAVNGATITDNSYDTSSSVYRSAIESTLYKNGANKTYLKTYGSQGTIDIDTVFGNTNNGEGIVSVHSGSFVLGFKPVTETGLTGYHDLVESINNLGFESKNANIGFKSLKGNMDLLSGKDLSVHSYDNISIKSKSNNTALSKELLLNAGGLDLIASSGQFNINTSNPLLFNVRSNKFLVSSSNLKIGTNGDVSILGSNGFHFNVGGPGKFNVEYATGKLTTTEAEFQNNIVFNDAKVNGVTGGLPSLASFINDVKTGYYSNVPSDIRLKNVSGDNTAGLKEINKLQVKNYTYKDDKAKTPHVGVIAQDLQKIFPNAVSKDDKGYLRIRTEDILFALVNSVKELCTQVQDLVAKVTGLDKRITELEKQNQQLKKQNEAFEKRLQKLEKASK